MAEQVLLDTNILIDVLANRKPFVNESKAVWDAHVNRSTVLTPGELLAKLGLKGES